MFITLQLQYTHLHHVTMLISCFLNIATSSVYWNGPITKCAATAVPSCKYWLKSLGNVFSKQLNLCHKELGRFWRQRGLKTQYWQGVPKKGDIECMSPMLVVENIMTQSQYYPSTLSTDLILLCNFNDGNNPHTWLRVILNNKEKKRLM